MPASDMIGGDRPMRACGGHGVGCGAVDDHPRHVIDTGTGGEDVAYHLDCHAGMGCASCAAQTADADGATGAALLEHLTKEA